ncbi:TOMM precursor leader peptide-binding protein [Actinomadura sp. NEAU-AAG7]|uniref:TOMM precursor leader peptide-binding protein n=1 Tax=Actinomadura sp. NEAU-AAG7 TaxID=2839640 RepID=UPI001BE48702|nr:TOMM precursor leader peptide-binding protein [Actinomadura sp. NEAU-AAG7]MBT2207840.1 TOMM precursor leader peptide-binding protein [Actinomadura sp. NEAU-AAG7]
MPDVLLLGAGTLADAVARDTRVTGPGGASVVVSAADTWSTADHPRARSLSRERNIPWIPVRAELGRVVIGPFERPGEPGCADCAEQRRRANRLHSRAHDTVLADHRDELGGRPSAWLTGLAADTVAALVADEIDRSARGRARTSDALLYLDLRTLEVTRHAFLPDPMCPVCGGLDDDTEDAARIVPRPRRKLAPGRYRVRDLAAHRDALAATYVDAECGLIRLLARDSDAGSVIAAAWMGLRDGATEGGYGRTRSYESSELVAILEALERHGGMFPGGRRTAVRGSHTELRDRALDPVELGLYPPERQPPGYEPFDPDRRYDWVWGYSFRRDAPILVPETYAYYRVHASGKGRFVYEISNGCALGGCREEAILHGVLEVAERDAFLMTWYARMPVPRIDLGSARGPTVPLIAEAIRAETGYDVMAFDTTLEQGIPCAWVMAVDPSSRDDRPAAVCAAGSHLDPESAVENALSELGSILPDLVRRYPAERERARAMVDDPSRVREMADHSLLYGTREAFSRLDFLVGTPHTVRFADMRRPAALRHTDLGDDLRELARRYLDAGLDVIVVDQTTPEHRAFDLSCVKVIIPGTLPMTFGHDQRRVDGIPRLRDVPHRLGYRDAPLEPSDANPHPHPFP